MKCIILAGGSGERLWPISRELYPKSLLNLFGGNTLVQNVFKLASNLTADKNILTITNIRQCLDTVQQLKKYTKKPLVLSEPMSKNTAPAVASALTYLEGKKDETVAILPVDFSVSDEKKFIETIKNAEKLAQKGYIVSVGVKPKYPEVGFGYIKASKDKSKINNVEKFIEKPDIEEISKYTKEKHYYWNSGIYIAKVSVLKEAYSKYASNIISAMSKDMFDENNKIKFSYYENLPEISIDYAIIEKADNLSFVELKTKWKDYGSWHAIYNNADKDDDNNVLKGNVIAENIKNSFVYSSKELVAASGIENTVIIETEDAVLVCDESCCSNINKLVKHLKKSNDDTTKIQKTVFRPWGYYTCLNSGEGWLTKIITVSAGHKLSLQSHKYRSEHWVVLEGTATVILENETYVLNKRHSIDIPLNAKHSLQNLSKEPLKILEVQKGSYIGEDDIIRYEDMYGREQEQIVSLTE